ncbi:MAG: YraN family protein [Fimbriimonadaceae bacterium]|nr:YraN family protein [Fimbriimonadaceae bacterium]
MSEDRRHQLGKAAEDAAWRELRRRGYRLIARNWRCPLGEIDLIARHRGEVVIVEVKARADGTWGGPELAVHPAKQRRLSRLADAWLLAQRLDEVPLRFDVVAITLDDGSGRPCLEVFEDAFRHSA